MGSTNEQWVNMEEFPGYMISNHGRVYNESSERYLKVKTHGWVTSAVEIYKGDMRTSRSVGALVAQHFIPEWVEGVNHRYIDGDLSNNHVDNLELIDWTTREPREPNPNIKGYAWAKRVRIVEWDQEFDSVRLLADEIGGDPSCIYKVLKGINRSHLGLTFEYAE